MRRRHVAGLLATVMLFAFVNNAFALWPAGVYRFDAIKGTVLDKETRKPIEGVVVVGHWGLETNQIMSSSYSGPLVVKEVVTDKDGKFTIPSSLVTDIHKRGHFNAEMYPEIGFFKSGYEFTSYRKNGSVPLSGSGYPESYNNLREDEYRMPKWLPDRRNVPIDKMRGVKFSFDLTTVARACADYEQLTPLYLAALRREHERIAKMDTELAQDFAAEFRLNLMESCIKKLQNRKLP